MAILARIPIPVSVSCGVCPNSGSRLYFPLSDCNEGRYPSDAFVLLQSLCARRVSRTSTEDAHAPHTSVLFVLYVRAIVPKPRTPCIPRPEDGHTYSMKQ